MRMCLHKIASLPGLLFSFIRNIRLKSTSNQERIFSLSQFYDSETKLLRVTTAVNRRCCHKSTLVEALRTQQKLTLNVNFHETKKWRWKKKNKSKKNCKEINQKVKLEKRNCTQTCPFNTCTRFGMWCWCCWWWSDLKAKRENLSTD